MSHRNVKYKHIVLEGSPYEVGKYQGELFKIGVEKETGYFPAIQAEKTLSSPDFFQAYEFFERYCPGINEEINGFADGVGIPHEQALFYTLTLQRQGNCSHFAVLPQITADGHTYVGRSYEWGLNDALRLCTTRIRGEAGHIGFSFGLFGRLDGINEYGLCVTMSNCIPGPEPNVSGLKFWGVIRTLLDQCKSVKEALDAIIDFPISSNVSLIIADKTGKAALVEIAPPHRSMKTIGPDSAEKFLCSTNHLTLPDMLRFDTSPRWFSVTRHETINDRLRISSPKLNKKNMKELLSAPMPAGLCAHYYSSGFGTLWSIIFDVTDATAYVCFGSPALNTWNRFNIQEPTGVREYEALLPLENLTNPEMFWGIV